MFMRQMAYFMTYKHAFGTMIDLVYRTLSQVKEFLLFFFFVIAILSCCMKALGYDIVNRNPIPDPNPYNYNSTTWFAEDWKSRQFVASDNAFIQYFIYAFSNAVG